MEIYSAIKQNEIMLFADRWIELENIMLSKVNKAQKEKSSKRSHVSPHMWKLG
jgi:hypothetical protein